MGPLFADLPDNFHAMRVKLKYDDASNNPGLAQPIR